jgi:DNA-binding CsgD family transcriptional regulator/Tfp pilus assembly protein PilF
MRCGAMRRGARVATGGGEDAPTTPCCMLRNPPWSWGFNVIDQLNPPPGDPQLIGRELECGLIDELLEAARSQGASGALVLAGEPGIGKTALLDWAARTSSVPFSRVTGVQAEIDVPFGALERLMLSLRRQLPEAFTRLGTRFDELLEAPYLDAPHQRDSFTVGALVLGLLAELASGPGLLLLVDDAQWLDRPTLEAIGFAARRVNAEGVVLIAATRQTEGDGARDDGVDGLAGLPCRRVHGLTSEAVQRLLSRRDGHAVALRQARVVARESHGNPLAILEMVRLSDEGRLTGAIPLYEPMPIGERLEHFYGDQVRRMPREAGLGLTIAAIMGDPPLRLFTLALEQAGLRATDLADAEAEGLLSIAGAGPRFSHPLVRSAILGQSDAATRRQAHGHVAAALEQSTRQQDQDRRVWHLAAMALATDDPIATMLEDMADRYRASGAVDSASGALERAADLTSDPVEYRRRLLAAARDALHGGDAVRARRLVEPILEEDAGNYEAVLVRSEVDMWQGRHESALTELRQAAAGAHQPVAKANLAFGAAYCAGLMGLPLVAQAMAREAIEAAGDEAVEIAAVAQVGLVAAQAMSGEVADFTLFGDLLIDYSRAHPEALPYATGFAFALLMVDDFETARRHLDHIVSTALAEGFASAVPFALAMRAVVWFRTGEWDRARAESHQALDLAQAMGHVTELADAHVVVGLVAAGQGDDELCSHHLEAGADIARSRGLRGLEAQALSIRGLLHLGLGQLEEAEACLTQTMEICLEVSLGEHGHWQWAPELVETRVMRGDTEAARPIADFVRAHAERTHRPIVEAWAERCAGMLAGPSAYESHFVHALAHHAAAARPFEEARTKLVFAERLRRERRSRDARAPLREALETFRRLDATPWADRARRELVAAGGHAAPKEAHRQMTDLTPQELMVALTVARGATNKEAAAELFLSPKTIEHHLTRTYQKLGIRSRSELVSAVARLAPS